jgi:hypothetical protein
MSEPEGHYAKQNNVKHRMTNTGWSCLHVESKTIALRASRIVTTKVGGVKEVGDVC